jgi:hypothetical protein
MHFSEIFDRERDSIITLVLTILAIWYTNYVDIFYFKYWVGDDEALAIYCFFGIVLHIIFQTIYQFIIFTRVKIKPSEQSYSEVMPRPLDGFSYFAMLDVEIPTGWEITDCYVTLEKIVPIYYYDKILIDQKFSEWLSDKIKPEFKKLRWKNPNSNQGECKVNIGEDSNKESILVGKVNNAIAKDVNGIDVKIDNFEFCLCSSKPTQIDFKNRGLYKISLVFHWKRSGRRMMDKIFNGYIYSDNWRIFVREGDYSKDKDIPKPLPKKIEAVHEAPLKRTIKERKKKKSSQKKDSH